MATVWLVVGSSLKAQVGWLGLRVGSCMVLSLHSLNELTKLSHWPCPDDSSINIVNGIYLVVMTTPSSVNSSTCQLSCIE